MYLSNLSHQIIYLKFQQQPFFFFFGKLKIHGGKNDDFFFFFESGKYVFKCTTIAESGERRLSSLIREIHIERAKVRFILACTFGAFLYFPY